MHISALVKVWNDMMVEQQLKAEMPFISYHGLLTNNINCDEMIKWCNENCKYSYLVNRFEIRFADINDYTSWKLRWW